MKLQIKDAGAWRDIGRFNAAREAEVRAIGAELMAGMENQKAVMRIVDGAMARAYCEAPFSTWRDV